MTQGYTRVTKFHQKY